jgi:hypothetical protein
MPTSEDIALGTFLSKLWFADPQLPQQLSTSIVHITKHLTNRSLSRSLHQFRPVKRLCRATLARSFGWTLGQKQAEESELLALSMRSRLKVEVATESWISVAGASSLNSQLCILLQPPERFAVWEDGLGSSRSPDCKQPITVAPVFSSLENLIPVEGYFIIWFSYLQSQKNIFFDHLWNLKVPLPQNIEPNIKPTAKLIRIYRSS